MIGLKSPNIQKLDLPASVKELSALLEFFKNPKKYDKYIKTLTERTDQLNKAIDNITKGKEIDNLLIEAQQLNQKAKDSLQGKAAEAALITQSARESSQMLLQTAKTDAEAVTLKAKALSESISKREAQLETNSIKLKQRESAVASAEKALISFESSLNKREKEVQRKEAIFSQLKA